jgi:ribosomal protein S6 kinase alpha-5
VDWWSLGVLTYELLTGASPFTVEGEKNIPADISKRILKSQPPIPRAFSKNAKDFILKLLNKIPLKRLGANGAQEIKDHPFFDSLNWKDLADKKIPAPFKPNIRNELDTNNFADEFTRQELTDSPAIVPTLNNDENLFRVKFNYNLLFIYLNLKLIEFIHFQIIIGLFVCGSFDHL